MLPMQVQSLKGIAHKLADEAKRLAITSMIQWVVISVLAVWIIYLLESAR
jgi:hypothetical protein